MVLPKASKQGTRKAEEAEDVPSPDPYHLTEGSSRPCFKGGIIFFFFYDRKHGRVKQTWVLESNRLNPNPRSAIC